MSKALSSALSKKRVDKMTLKSLTGDMKGWQKERDKLMKKPKSYRIKHF